MPGVEGLHDEVAKFQLSVQGCLLAVEGRQQADQGGASRRAGCHRFGRLGMVVVAKGGGIFDVGGFLAGGIHELEEGENRFLALAAGLHAILLVHGPGFLVPSEIESQAKGKDIYETDHRTVVGIRQVGNVNFGNGSGLDANQFLGQKPLLQLLPIHLGQLRAEDFGQAQRFWLLLQLRSQEEGLLFEIEPEFARRASGRGIRICRRRKPLDPNVEASASWLVADGEHS